MTQLDDVTTVQPDFDPTDRYRTDSGPTLMTGVQAIARQLVEQHARDQRAGRKVATFVSGYQGSPLAGLDRLLGALAGVGSQFFVRMHCIRTHISFIRKHRECSVHR